MGILINHPELTGEWGQVMLRKIITGGSALTKALAKRHNRPSLYADPESTNVNYAATEGIHVGQAIPYRQEVTI